ncbi:hypothetical protein AB0I35_13025 [Nocardia sp. NPDC050378]|uniref:hypothetical protein n=1 Tax=Nocardia sp. NPDC050378 TaxID=3155400 RepID=UPI0033DA6452
MLLFCGDTLATGDGPARAAQMRREVLAHHHEQINRAARIAAVHNAIQHIRELVEPDADDDADPSDEGRAA